MKIKDNHDLNSMPIFNHFGITNLYLSKEKTKSVKNIYVHICVVFMDALNVVAQRVTWPIFSIDRVERQEIVSFFSTVI